MVEVLASESSDAAVNSIIERQACAAWKMAHGFTRRDHDMEGRGRRTKRTVQGKGGLK